MRGLCAEAHNVHLRLCIMSYMRIITLEEHITTPAILKASADGQGVLSSSAFIQALHAKLLDTGAGRLADMDASGINVQVLSISSSPIDKLEPVAAQVLARDTNEILAAAVKAHPDRFAAFCTLALQEPAKAAAEL